MKTFLTMLFALSLTVPAYAQIKTTLPIDTARQKPGHKTSFSIGSGGIRYDSDEPDTVDHAFEIQYGMLDLGINSLDDRTAYPVNPYDKNLTPLNAYLPQNPDYKNKDLFSLRQSKSINVNIYPVMVKARLYKSARQQITLASGIGLQLYNFRFTKPVTYVSSPTTHLILDTVSFSKNKLAFSYLTVPLMLNGKTRIARVAHSTREDDQTGSTYGKGYWLTYGVGVSGGYLLSSWTKQISDERGKDKNFDAFNFRKTNFCVNGEIGLDGYIRLYASYQLTSLHEDVLDQHPFCIGVRFLGL